MVESHSKFRVVAKAVRRDAADGSSVYRSSYRILDTQGEEIEISEGGVDFDDITSAFNEAFANGHERLRHIDPVTE
jgi:hypothetical protein